MARLAFISTMALLSACRGGGGKDGGGGDHIINPPPPTGAAAISLLAGTAGGPGNVDGTMASFNNPSGVATDSAGNVYVADTNNHLIRKITPAGVVNTFAGAIGGGSADGIGTAASFVYPGGVATDNAGNVYVADSDNHLIRKITTAGVVSTLAGANARGSADGTGTAASFDSPQGVAIDSAGNVYVADTYNELIRKITPAGVVSTLAGTASASGSADGMGTAARFYHPSGVAGDSAGNVYVADYGNHLIRKITSDGVVSTLAGTASVSGSADGTGTAASFFHPSGVATDSAGNVYVADSGNHVIRKITPAGVVSTLAGTATRSGSADGTGTTASFNYPNGVAIDSTGNVVVADAGNYMIRKITPAGDVSTVAGTVDKFGHADGTGAAARFDSPYGVAGDSSGNVYVADVGNHLIRKITPAGAVSTLAGTPGSHGYADGNGAAASFYYPSGVATDSAGNVYVADTSNYLIRKITPAGVVSTFAGTANHAGRADGIGTAASFNSIRGLATDNGGNLYVADTDNHLIRKITPAGDVSTLAGTARVSGSADGAGTAASFYYPRGIAMDGTGNVYVADTSNHLIRKITPAGVVSTLAGTATVSGAADGTGTAASFNWPTGVATDSAGNVYVADNGNNLIRKITPAGVVSTVVGTAGRYGFATGALPGYTTAPYGIALRGTTLYFTSNNGVVQVTNLN